MQSPRKIHLGGSMLANKTFLFVDQSSPDLFHGTREESLSISFFSDFRYLESFQRYSRPKSKVVKNRAEFWAFFSPSQILGGRPFKSYTNVMSHASRRRHVVWKIFCAPRLVKTLNFKPMMMTTMMKIITIIMLCVTLLHTNNIITY